MAPNIAAPPLGGASISNGTSYPYVSDKNFSSLHAIGAPHSLKDTRHTTTIPHAPNAADGHSLGGAQNPQGNSFLTSPHPYSSDSLAMATVLPSFPQEARAGMGTQGSVLDISSTFTFPPRHDRIHTPHNPINLRGGMHFVDVARPSIRPSCTLPVRKGDFLSINIDDHVHHQGVRELQDTLIGRILLKQGVKPMPTSNLKASIDKIWNVQGAWFLVPLGKGYFNIRMEDLAERDRIFKRRSWLTEFGTLRLQQWIPKFNSYKVSSPMVNVWVRIYDCPWNISKSL